MSTLKAPPAGTPVVLGIADGNTPFTVDVGDGHTILVYAALREQAANLAKNEGYIVFNVQAAA